MASRVLGLSIAVAVLVLDTTAAQALRYKQCNIRATEPCTADVFPGKVTVLSFETTVRSVYTAQTSPRFVIEKYSHEVTVEARPGADYTNIEIQLDERKLGVLVNVVDSFADHDGRIEFYDPLKRKAERTKVVAQEFDSYLAGLVMQGFGVVQSRFEPAGPDRLLPLAMRLVTMRMGHEVKLVLGLTNVGDEPVRLEAIRVTSPGRLDDHVGFIRVESGQPGGGRRLADIVPGDSAQVYIALKEPLALGRLGIVTLLAATGQSQSSYIQIWPPPDGPSAEELERDKLGKLSSLGLRAAAGGCWLARSSEANQIDIVPCFTVGLRFGQGLTPLLAVEAEASGGWSESDATRTASFGRVTAAAVLRLGQSTIPYLRAGLGGQVARIDSANEAGALLVLGGGVDKRLGQSIVVGAGLSFENDWKGLGTGERLFGFSLALGAQLSYAWQP